MSSLTLGASPASDSSAQAVCTGKRARVLCPWGAPGPAACLSDLKLEGEEYGRMQTEQSRGSWLSPRSTQLRAPGGSILLLSMTSAPPALERLCTARPPGRTLPVPLSPQDCPRVFSAGLDLTEVCGRNPAHYTEYWKAVQELWLRTYLSSLVLVAAINVRVPPRGAAWVAHCGPALGVGGHSPPLESPQKGRGQSGRPTEVSLPLQTR